MQDRVPLHPGRVKLTPVSGQENTYDMTRADEPTQEGTPLNKSTLLKDTTAALYGLGADAVPDDMFTRIAKMLGGFLVKVNIQIAGVAAGAGISVTGITGINGEALVTDSSGSVTGLLHSKTATITVDKSTVEEVDILQAENTFTIDSNYAAYSETTVNLQPAAQGFILVDTSKTIKFSANVSTVDLFLVGGGAGGTAGVKLYSSGNAKGYGGGGGTVVTETDVAINGHAVSCLIGAAGSGATASRTSSSSSITYADGNPGGATSAIVDGVTYSAAGGEVRKTSSNGTDGSSPFGSSAFGNQMGASGGGALAYNDGEGDYGNSGGVYGGGRGVVSNNASGRDGSYYGAGGGGAAKSNNTVSYSSVSITSGNGYKGCVVIRWGY